VKKLIVVLALVMVVLAGAAYWMSNPHSSGPGTEGFTFQPVEWGMLTDSVNAPGLVQPKEIAAVGSEASGRVIEVLPAAEPGQTVTAGQPLLKLDPSLAQIRLDQAQAAVKLAATDVTRAEAARDSAQVAVDRAKELLKAGGLQRDVDLAEAQLKVAVAAVAAAQAKVKEAGVAVQLAKKGLDLLTVTAPVGGVILERKVVLGQLIGPPASAQLFTMAANGLEQMEVHAQVAESDIRRVRRGLPVEFTLYAYPDGDVRFANKKTSTEDTKDCTVTQIHPTPIKISEHVTAVFYDTVITVRNRKDPQTGEWMLRPGMSASTEIIVRKHEAVWKLPTQALDFQLDEHYQSPEAKAQLADWPERHGASNDWKPVWIMKDKKPWPIFVRTGGTYKEDPYKGETGIRNSQYVEVLEWDPELTPRPDPQAPATYPQLIIGEPPVKKPGLFDQPSRFKLS
jgi:RND family efflux transporter MFP subunit